MLPWEGHLLQLAQWPNKGYRHVQTIRDKGPTTRWLKPGEEPAPYSEDRPIGGKFTTREPWNQAAWAREFARSRDMVVEGYLSNDSFFQFDAVVHGLHALVVATRSVLRHFWQPVELSSAAWPQGQAA